MVAFVLPAVLVPFGAYERTGMVGYKSQICNLDSLGEILGLIESLDFEEGVDSGLTADRKKRTFIKTLAVSPVNIST